MIRWTSIFRKSALAMHGMWRLLVVVAAFCICFAAADNAWAKKIHLLIVADTDDPAVGKDVEKDWKNIRQRFLENVPESQLSIAELTGKKATREGILSAIKNIKASADDTIVFAFAGHGLFDETIENGVERGHALQLTHGPAGNPVKITVPGTAIAVNINEQRLIYRTVLVQAIEDKKMRLAVLWTDCCNTVVAVTDSAPGKSRAAITSPSTVSPLFDSLFFQPSGLIDLITSQKGEMAYGDEVGREGGIATVAFCRFLRARRQEPLTWDEAFAVVSQSIADEFRKSFPRGAGRAQFGLQPQATQTLHRAAWQLGDVTTTVKGPFGVTVVADPQKRGVKVTKLVSGSAAEKRVVARIGGQDVIGGFTIGDIITHVNDQAVRTEKEFADAFDKSGPLLKLQFLNSGDSFSTVTASVDLSVR